MAFGKWDQNGTLNRLAPKIVMGSLGVFLFIA